MLRPSSISELAEAIGTARASGQRLELRGGGSKAGIGQQRETTILSMQGFAGVIDYDPPELVLTAGAATPLAEIEALLAAQGQMLAFDPYDHGRLFGSAEAATLGGVIAAGVSGSRRLSAGAVRDHFLGFRAVSGRGEAFIGGAKVVKNVTGYDLPKLMANSWGRLAALTEVTLKVLPRPRASATIVLPGLSDEAAILAMAQAMGSQAEVAAAAHVPAALCNPALTALRLEGFAPSVQARTQMLLALFKPQGPDVLLEADSAALWDGIRHAAPLAGEGTLWRINVPPTAGAQVTQPLAAMGAYWLYDWAGGLIWLQLPPGADGLAVRAAASAAGGHAVLVRGDGGGLPILHPESPGVAALSARVKAAFDPDGILDPHRFG